MDQAPVRRPRARLRWLVVALGVVALVVVTSVVTTHVRETWRTTPIHDPPVLAGRIFMAWCSGGFYVRKDDAVYLTAAGHCAPEGYEVTSREGEPIGVFGPKATMERCPYPGKACLQTDLGIVRLVPTAIPWGHLNEVDMGAGGYRILGPDTRALACDDIRSGDLVEINGRDHYRSGRVVEKGENLYEADPNYFPCIIAADVRAQSTDSGGAVLVNGMPAGTISRSFQGYLGFTPLAEGLAALGLELCTDPNCGLTPP